MNLKKTVALLSLSAFGSQAAWAGTVNVQTHTATANTRYAKTETAASEGVDRYIISFDYNYVNDPLVEVNPTRERRISTLVEGVQTLDLTVGREFGDFASLNFTLPLNLVSEASGRRSFALGDARVFSKHYLLGRKAPFQLALVPELRLPTGDGSWFVSDGTLSYGATLAVEKSFGFFSVAANAGYRYSSGATFRDVDYRHRVPLSVALSVPLTQQLSMVSEASGARVLPLNRYQNPGEFYAGVRYQWSPEMTFTGGGAVGAVDRVGSSDVRMMVGLKFTPLATRSVAQVDTSRSAQKDVVKLSQSQALPRLEINHSVLFAHDSAVLLPSATPLLKQVVAFYEQNRERIRSLAVEGHCNELGTDAYNLALSKRRAESVRRFLVSHGIPASALKTEGYGESRPKPRTASMTRPAWLEINRRVEFATQ